MMSPTEATEMILATAMAAAGQYSLQHAEIKDVLTVIFPNSVKTTSVLTGMDSLRGEAVMSEGDLEVWQSHVERLHHTITNDKEQRCWFITRRGDCFDVWHVARSDCIEAHRAYLSAPTMDQAAMRLQGAISGYRCRRVKG
jgi:hypothetical protein